MILITTPTGDIGARVLRHVLNAGAHVRVICREPARLPHDIAARVDIVHGSHGDAGVVQRALGGVTAVFWLPPGNPTEPSAEAAYVDFSRPFCEALPLSDVTHVVAISALGRGWPKPAGHVTATLRMDDLIGATGVAYRALTCASLMDNLMRQVEPVRDLGMFFAPTPGDLQLPQVAKSDVADVVARLLLSPDWTGVEDVPLCGPDDISFVEMAATMSTVLGKAIGFQEMSMDQFAGMLRANGASEGIAQAYVEMLTAKNEGMDTMIRPAPRTNTPTTFEVWCQTELRPALLS
ncbi:NAD(P)H-binding protein [Fertoebacter nigrum]|uniref:NAD(P)H-binding protein n=1 Tax=Fertoeibacter niger TaxID=2656921 RepID=A0A8X8KPK7_9RHOB|nr:NAD(P)H-binding protein [Fertoeibacter niger]NUB45006.1 NAD(P)H-binding protein [Fertoeibacter niger]